MARATVLYEFTYTDNLGRSDEEREAGLKDFLLEESFVHGWAPGYRWSVVRTQVEADFIRYHYQVTGRYWEGTRDN